MSSCLKKEEIVKLLLLDPFSSEAKDINEKALSIGKKACGGRSLVFGQIGVDDSICPENCAYCSFALRNFEKIYNHGSHKLKKSEMMAAINKHNAKSVISEELLRQHLLSFNEANVDAVSLMGTAALPFKDYLNMIKISREILNPKIGVIVNYRDMSDNEIYELEQAGATHVYHTVRIREGKITGIHPEKRRATIKLVQKTKMKLMNGVEPVWEPFDESVASDVADAILEAVSQNPQVTGSCGLCEVKNSTFAGKPPSNERVQLVASVLRIVAGVKIPYGCVGGISWVDAGADPRERGFSDSRKTIIYEVEKARSAKIKEGWERLDSPL